MDEVLLVVLILAGVTLTAVWMMPDALHALAGKLLEREAYVLAGREARRAQARSWGIGQAWLRDKERRRVSAP